MYTIKTEISKPKGGHNFEISPQNLQEEQFLKGMHNLRTVHAVTLLRFKFRDKKTHFFKVKYFSKWLIPSKAAVGF